MGSKRVGLARTQALLEGLKRELAMGGTIFSDADQRGPEQETSGDGAQSGSIGPPTTRITSLNGEIITTITIDLTDLSANNSVGKVIGNADLAADNPAADAQAQLLTYNTDTHGILYKVQMSCLELPANSGTDLKDFDLIMVDDVMEAGNNASGAGSAVVILAGGGNTAAGTTQESLACGAPTDDQFLYICDGATSSATKFTAGKLVIRLYGHRDFGD